MIIAIGTKNKAKLSACYAAINDLQTRFNWQNGPLEYSEYAAPSSVDDMPLTLKDLMNGARNRALFVFDRMDSNTKVPVYSIGMEGGVHQIKFDNEQPPHTFLQSWVYVYNGTTGFFGASPLLPIPDQISNSLYLEKKELSEVIDRLSGKEDVRSNEGTFGILTRNLLTRADSFKMAVINAFVPFFNHSFYSNGVHLDHR
ncbi:MAG: DUF84 family protein [Caldithrix sp.]|nr:DUF84 family protein [Caldithrix sp.]